MWCISAKYQALLDRPLFRSLFPVSRFPRTLELLLNVAEHGLYVQHRGSFLPKWSTNSKVSRSRPSCRIHEPCICICIGVVVVHYFSHRFRFPFFFSFLFLAFLALFASSLRSTFEVQELKSRFFEQRGHLKYLYPRVATTLDAFWVCLLYTSPSPRD